MLGELVGKGVWLEEHEDGPSSHVVQMFLGSNCKGQGFTTSVVWL